MDAWVVFLIVVIILVLGYLIYAKRPVNLTCPRHVRLMASLKPGDEAVTIQAYWKPPAANQKLKITGYDFELGRVQFQNTPKSDVSVNGTTTPDMREMKYAIKLSDEPQGLYVFRIQTLYQGKDGIQAKSPWAYSYLDMPTITNPKPNSQAASSLSHQNNSDNNQFVYNSSNDEPLINNTPTSRTLLSTSPFWYESPWFQGGAQEAML